ncbi:MAG TPA: thermonuclease family protein [Victivallales bacterium]|nr:thermonuclease family protein [Victivallales bacterium]|tara:strand:+ start:69 stop:338 length:270 start_codon:yes stop_codon:yes gene_type:complete
MKIRLNDIDTPELRTKSAKKKQLARTAKRLVGSLLKNAKVIELRNMQTGKYFRIVADVYFDGKNLGDILIKNKLAVRYGRGTKTKDWSK